MSVGPIQLIAIGFQDFEATGKVMPALLEAQHEGAIRIIDVQFVSKGDDGQITSMEMSGLSPNEQIEFGATIGALLGAGAGGEEGAEIGAVEGAMAAISHSYGMTLDDVQAVADALPAGGAAALVIIEHTWATNFRDAAIGAGGEMLAQGFLTPKTVMMMGAEIEAQAEAAAAIEMSAIIQEEAAYRALFAVALSEAIQEEAANNAVAALIAAEIIEEAAMEEVVEVLSLAYVIEEEAIERAEAAIEMADDMEAMSTNGSG
jgi:uncharacterized membrane protein